ncbi:MAG: universal stress protein [Balneolales bacterium]
MQNPRILVTTDFSDLGNKAFKAAEILAESFNGKIIPFHAYMISHEVHDAYATQMMGDSGEYENTEGELLDQLNKTAEGIIDSKYLNPGKVTVGYPATCILNAAEDFDIIVISSHGRTGISRLLMGSVAEKVLRLSKKPVLVVEDNSNIKPINKILVTTDLSDASEAAFPWARELAIANDADIDVVNVVSFEQTTAVGFYNRTYEKSLIESIQENLLNLIDKHFSDIKSRVKSKVIDSNLSAHQRLAELVENSSYNMVVMATVGHSGVDYLLLGSTTASLVRRVDTAVLVIHPE